MVGLPSVVRLLFFLPVSFLMYWSLQLAGFFYRVKFLSFKVGRNDLFEWGHFCCRLFGVRLVRTGERQLHRGGPCIYLCNHRSWADFFIDMCATEGRAAALSRYMVVVAFPMFMLYAKTIRCMLLFKRTAIQDKEKFNNWLDASLEGSPVPGLIVYPEGHRNTKPESLPLRRGMLKYAFSRKLPLQIIMASGKEDVLSEKQFTVGFGQKVVVGYSDLIHASEFPDFETYFLKIKVEWDKMWTDVFSAKEEEAEEMDFEGIERFHLPFMVRAQLASVMVFTIFSMLSTVYLSLKGMEKLVSVFL